jgi:phosphatidate cytidylyltransferase
MKKTIMAIILLAIAIPILIIGGNLYNTGVYIISLIALNEFLNIKNEKKQIPLFIKTISFISMTFLIFTRLNIKTLEYVIDYRVLAGIFILFLLPSILYHDRTKYSINDAFYLIGSTIFLGTSLSLLISIRNISLNLLIYLLLISTIADTYALITGKLIGKRKLSKEISPSKTIEGLIGGLLFGTFIPMMYYKTVINPNISIITLLLITLFLCLLGQLGDLSFSAIKRYFGKKDFSNLIPEHGGILDRFDSIIFILLGFTFFINIIGG